MAKVKGLAIFLKVNTGTVAIPVWTKVGGQSDATLDRGVSTMDVTDKDSTDEEHLIGIGNWGISFSAFLIEDDAGFLEIESSFDARTQLQYQIVTPTATYMAAATVESLSVSAPLSEAGVVSFTLKGTGSLAKT